MSKLEAPTVDARALLAEARTHLENISVLGDRNGPIPKLVARIDTALASQPAPDHAGLAERLKAAGCTSPDGTFVTAPTREVIAALSRAAEPVAFRTRGMNSRSEWMHWTMVDFAGAERWRKDPSFRNGRREVEPLYATPPAPQGDGIADAVLSWMVKRGFLDADNEYRDTDVLSVLDTLAPQGDGVPEENSNAKEI